MDPELLERKMRYRHQTSYFLTHYICLYLKEPYGIQEKTYSPADTDRPIKRVVQYSDTLREVRRR